MGGTSWLGATDGMGWYGAAGVGMLGACGSCGIGGTNGTGGTLGSDVGIVGITVGSGLGLIFWPRSCGGILFPFVFLNAND
jgi:hypothetical protein